MSNETPLEQAETFALRFRGNANSLAMAYGGPLYLVGSVLTSLEPGDIDLRLCLERADMEALFGGDIETRGLEWSNAVWRREREQLKQSRRLTRRWRGGCPAWRFDFQFQVALMSESTGLPIMREEKPNLRLDTVPLSYFAAGRGDP